MSHQRLPKALLEWGCMCEAAEGKVLQDLESMAADRAQLALAISVVWWRRWWWWWKWWWWQWWWWFKIVSPEQIVGPWKSPLHIHVIKTRSKKIRWHKKTINKGLHTSQSLLYLNTLSAPSPPPERSRCDSQFPEPAKPPPQVNYSRCTCDKKIKHPTVFCTFKVSR